MPRAFIGGCSGLRLTAGERGFFRRADPWGLILFARNCDNPDQVRALIEDFRSSVSHHAAVLIDQEGGRVQRLNPPHWTAYPAAAVFGRAVRDKRPGAEDMARALGQCLAAELADLTITMNCAPVADVPVAGAHEVIGDRAFSDDGAVVGLLAGAMAQGMLSGGVVPIVKHIPGHGRAIADSHLELPHVTAPANILRESDFKPFTALNHLPAAMTAHVVYTAFDPSNPATLSPVMVDEIIRKEIGFDGLLISDDLSMMALSGPLRTRVQHALEAGVDLALHCNGILAEMEEVADASPKLSGRAARRCAAALDAAQAKPAADPVELRVKLLNWAAESK